MDKPIQRVSGRKFFMIGWSVIVIVFGGLFAWSALAPFEGAVMASGSISVASNHKAIQHLEGGIVSEILVTEGDTVNAGDVLIRLDDTTVEASLARLNARLVDLVAREARLSAEVEGRADTEMRAGLEDLRDSPELQATQTAQRELMAARGQSRTTQLAVLNQRIQQLSRRIDGLDAEVAAKSAQIPLIDEEVAGLQSLFDKGLAPRTRILALQRERSDLLGARDALRAEIEATRVQIGEARLERLRLTEGFREDALNELAQVQTEIAEILEERAAFTDRRARLDIRAPRSGRAIGVRAHTIGGVIGPGTPILHIVPADDKLIALVRISPQDIDKVDPGRAATLRFSAFSQSETPEVTGKVQRVSADAIQDEQTGAPFYEVVVELPEDDASLNRFVLVPGMPVEAMVRTESRNVLSYLTKPVRDSMARTFRE